jgi:hypothetical protein
MTNNVIPLRPRQPSPDRTERRELSPGDEALIRAVMAHHGWSYEEARERLELSGM